MNSNIRPPSKDVFKNEYNFKNKNDFKNDDELRNEDKLQNYSNFKSECYLTN